MFLKCISDCQVSLLLFFQMWESLSPAPSNIWKCGHARRADCFSVLIGHSVSRYLLSTSCAAGYFLAHQFLEFGVCGGFYTWQRGLGTGEAGGWRGHGEGQRTWTAFCYPPVRKPISQPCMDAFQNSVSLSALLSLPPEKQDLEKFQVKNQPSNSTVGYSKEEKNKNQCEPGFRF